MEIPRVKKITCFYNVLLKCKLITIKDILFTFLSLNTRYKLNLKHKIIKIDIHIGHIFNQAVVWS